ncbi:DNA-binding protein P3A2 [Nymphon striatum]|nr:DNA-binding protein P3A2 [Nymphon striatum]
MISNSDLTSTIQATMNHASSVDMIKDEMSDSPSSPDSTAFDDSDLLNSSIVGDDDITAQLAASGPVGVAAAAAIATSKKRKRPHSFETNPSIRKRQQTRLLRTTIKTDINHTRYACAWTNIGFEKMKTLIDEYSTRVGLQVVVVQCTPGKPHNNFKVFGAKPLEGVICNYARVGSCISPASTAPPQATEDPSLHELPPLMVDGIPTPVEKMTQAQLRTFIPLMLKYSTGRGKPGWGKESTRPVWWPKDLPWANVRSDVRTEEEKQRVSWTHALRQIVINCYKHHGRDDLLPQFSEDDDDKKVKTEPQITEHQQQVITHYTPTMVQTINNPDGTVSIIHVDPTNAVVTLPDGTQAQVQAVSAIETTQGESTNAADSLTEVSSSQHHQGVVTQTATVASMNMNLDLNGEGGTQQLATLTEATINQDGHLILSSGEDVSQAFPVSGMVTIPVSMYQTVVANISQLTGGADGHTVTPIQVAMPHSTVLQSSLQNATTVHSSDLKISENQNQQSQCEETSPQPEIEILHVHSVEQPATSTTPIESSNGPTDMNISEGQ